MATTTSTWTAGRLLALLGLLLYVGTGVFPYLASGLVAPLWGIAVLWVGWLLGARALSEPRHETPNNDRRTSHRDGSRRW